MLNEKQQLSPRLFSKDIDEVAIRDGYGAGLVEIGLDPHVVVLVADLEESTRTNVFKRMYPERTIEVGVAEQHMAAMAAGLGVSGKTVFINSYATFSPGRNWEQIRTLCAYNDANVKIAGHHAGISTGPDGATHQAIEDIAIMRAMPNMRVIVPCDVHEAQRATKAAAQLWGPVYIRLQREKTPVMTTAQTPFELGKVQQFWVGKKKAPDAVIYGAGGILYEALLAAKELEKEKISVDVVNVHTIKPLDVKGIIAHAKKAQAGVVVEEHSVVGGLGSAIAEALGTHYPMPLEFVGVQDIFGQSGTPHELIKRYGLDAVHIMQAVRKAIKRKK